MKAHLNFQTLIYLLLVLFVFNSCKKDNEEPVDSNTDGYEGYTLEWSDEFNSQLNFDNWVYEIGDGTAYGLPPGWGNAERQNYTDISNNSLIRGDGEGNSVLAITAQKEPGDNRFSSAKLTTQGLRGFRFGRVEARIKVPEGKGFWPAFWMLGENITQVDWPGCGEIDIMEVIGDRTNIVNGTVHFTNSENKPDSNGDGFDAGVNLAADYHIYRMDWTPELITFSLDGNEYHQVPIEDDMKEFLRSFYLILNLAVGGNWPGDPDETTVFPSSMFVDWVRVYSKDGGANPAEPPLDLEEESLGMISTSLPPFGFNESLGQFSNMIVKSFGDGGEPDVFTSDIVVDGDSSLLFKYPGGTWGGAFFELKPTVDANQFVNGNLKFSLNAPIELHDIEIKLESVATAFSLFLKDYQGVDVGNGFKEYTIPVADFEGLDMSDLKIPFALWNAMDENEQFIPVDVLLDNVYFEE